MTNISSPSRIKINRGDCRGVTLVELLVAATLLVVGIVSLLTIVGVMQKERSVDYHRRMARTAMNRVFEGAFNVSDCPGPYTVVKKLVNPDSGGIVIDTAKIVVYVNPGNTARTLQSGTDLPLVPIDKRYGYAPIMGNMKAEFAFEEITVSGRKIDTHKLTLTVAWKEVGDADTTRVSLTRRLTETTRGY
jgi:type II secretory pathway pseudopilin PulG